MKETLQSCRWVRVEFPLRKKTKFYNWWIPVDIWNFSFFLNSEFDKTVEGWQRYYWEAIKRTFGFGAFLLWSLARHNDIPLLSLSQKSFCRLYLSYLHLSAVMISLIQQFLFFFSGFLLWMKVWLRDLGRKWTEPIPDETKSSIIFIYFP